MASECAVARAKMALMPSCSFFIGPPEGSKFDRHRFPISAYRTLVDPLFVTVAICLARCATETNAIRNLDSGVCQSAATEMDHDDCGMCVPSLILAGAQIVSRS